jgi:hypothetical protein
MVNVKIRVWDKRLNEMIYNPQDASDYLIADRYEIMQYIGFKDRNNKDIYGGDIIKYSKLCQIIWMEDNKRWEAKNLDGVISFTECEIIGNIYEDAEFLRMGNL